jgi:hypothetical protein
VSREITTQIIEACDDGALSWELVARECMSYMSEDEVSDMNRVAEFVQDEDDGGEF